MNRKITREQAGRRTLREAIDLIPDNDLAGAERCLERIERHRESGHSRVPVPPARNKAFISMNDVEGRLARLLPCLVQPRGGLLQIPRPKCSKALLVRRALR